MKYGRYYKEKFVLTNLTLNIKLFHCDSIKSKSKSCLSDKTAKIFEHPVKGVEMFKLNDVNRK